MSAEETEEKSLLEYGRIFLKVVGYNVIWKNVVLDVFGKLR